MFDVTKQFDLMSAAEFTHAQNVNAAAAEVRTLTEDEGKLEFAHRNAASAADEQTSAEDQLKQKMDELRVLMAGPVGQENQKYYDKQIEIRDKMVEMRDKILELQNAQGTLSADAAQKIGEMKASYGELQQKYDETAAAHEEATRRILYDLLQQQLSVDGLTERESLVLAGVAEKWGLIDSATSQAWQQLGTYTSMVNDASVSVDTLVSGIANIPSEKTITISADVQSLLEEIMAAWDNSVPEGHQTGADFVVPPGYPNDSFLLRAQSGERVQVTPAGETPREMAMAGGGSSQALIGEIRGLREVMMLQGRPATAWEIATSLRDVLAPVMG
jgi:myosin heavy subunit